MDFIAFQTSVFQPLHLAFFNFLNWSMVFIASSSHSWFATMLCHRKVGLCL